MADDDDGDGDRGGRAPGGRTDRGRRRYPAGPGENMAYPGGAEANRTAERKKKDGAKGRKDTRGVSELGGGVLKELSRHLTTGDVKLGCRRGPEGNF